MERPTPRAIPAEAELSSDEKLELYYFMVLTRAVDERCHTLFKQGRIPGSIFSQLGHEAIACGSAFALGPNDVVARMHRDLGSYLVRGMSPARIFAQALGRVGGPTRGRDVNTHGLGDASLGIYGYVSHLPQSLPVALGAAFAFDYRNEPRVAMAYTGDGSSSQGGFHETLNIASVLEAPLVIVLENNGWAYSTPTSLQYKIEDLAERAKGYDIPGVIVDGNDVLAVYAASRAAVERARSGGGPTLLEMKTMRMRGHAVHDPADYVPRELLERWAARDPIALFEAALRDEDLLTDSTRAEVHARVEAEIARAVDEAESSPFPDPDTLTDGVYA
ncbi:MAG TPA: thiamine pyrophosphate-dependent dehydrogenase E1 component subunit alpha [Planctomycetota bacterium]|nr:thiamine pyrophosphate-dependent dehydrogenase E1 component subunit alpha [Planctomycetota bacterium]